MTTRYLAAAGALSAMLSATALQAQEVELALGHWVGPTHPMHVTGMEPWARSIEAASEGRIRINIFPAAQLGAAFDHFDMARDGIADITWVNPGNMPGRFPVLSLGEQPFLVGDAKAGSQALHQWYLDYAGTEMREVELCMVHLHDVSTLHGNAPILVPEDLRGKNVRPPNGTIGRFISMLGGAAVALPPSEMRDAMARGMTDFTASPWTSLFTWGAYEHVSHSLDMPLYVTVFVVVINRDTWNDLSPANRAVMEEHCSPDWSGRIAAGWIDLEAGGRDRLAEREGHVFHTPDAEQAQMWRAAAAPLLDEWRAAVTAAGHDAEAAHAGLIETLRSLGALAE